MNIRLIAMILSLAISLTGCGDKFIRRNTVTIAVNGLPLRRSYESILVDPSLNPEVNESSSGGFFSHSKQKVVINSDRPLKLVPDTSEPTIDKVNTNHTATIIVNGPRTPEPIYPILIDPSLKTEVNDTHRVLDFWGVDIKQEVKVSSRIPLRLVPATPEEMAKAQIQPRP